MQHPVEKGENGGYCFRIVNHWYFVKQILIQIKFPFRGQGYMILEILTPEQKIFSGDVYGVQLPGIGGSFELLDRHAPMVSALKDGVLKILKDKTETVSYSIKSGFVEVLNNKATVLVEGAVES